MMKHRMVINMDDISSTQDLIKIVRTIANQEIKKSIVNIGFVNLNSLI